MTSQALDDAYERLRNTGPEFEGWLSNHGPMAADALIRIGHEEDVSRWVDGYKARLDERPRERWRFEAKDWQEYLGDPSRLGDWLALFEREMRSEPWQDILTRWWPRLIPGATASATHGLIRTGHAVRALLESVTDPRVEELGQALGYWAARWQAIPGTPPLTGCQPFATTLDQLPTIDVDGGVRTRFLYLRDNPEWNASVTSADEPLDADSIPSSLTTLTDEAVRRYLRWGHGNAVMLVHAATAPRAALLALPALPMELWRETFHHVWAASAAITSAYKPHQEYIVREAGLDALEPAEISALASTNHDEHVIKFVEVALESHGRGVAEALEAARRAIDLVTPNW